ncbi:hypothetical protein RHMOL_Rhmol08G0198300 [Rhododendron molle]|uniref:Uncharacterized protein n=1 Tax=Rhododendron molle TaxID=49168 RepID=A0ACC0MQD6_RHOML|nr:hypothetical protein RHMOL_Rhmol08G0198300 [Rhododendron molle]
MALLHRLNTEDRLVKFGLKSSSQCTFCHDAENHAHLFFDCPMATHIRTILSPKAPHMIGHQAWQPWVDCLSNLRGKSLANTIAKLNSESKTDYPDECHSTMDFEVMFMPNQQGMSLGSPFAEGDVLCMMMYSCWNSV